MNPGGARVISWGNVALFVGVFVTVALLGRALCKAPERKVPPRPAVEEPNGSLSVSGPHLRNGTRVLLRRAGETGPLAVTYLDPAAPAGSRARLSCGFARADGAVVPVQGLAALYGKPPFAGWDLQVSDRAAEQEGTLKRWFVHFSAAALPPGRRPSAPARLRTGA